MARVDFAFGASDRVTQAARTTLRHVAKGARVFAYSTQAPRLESFDQALWTIDDIAFVPHEPLGERATPGLRVYLVNAQSWGLLRETIGPGDWLLNLDDDCPPSIEGIDRVLEIVTEDDLDRELARTRWRHYQQLGAELHAHKLI